MWAWLNPKTLLGLFGLVKMVFNYATIFLKWLADFTRQRKQNKNLAEFDEAQKLIDNANTIKDPNEKLREKAKAACELERALDPSSEC